jgi:hypothetical protein
MTTVANPAGTAAPVRQLSAGPPARPAGPAARPAGRAARPMPFMLRWTLVGLVGVSLLWGAVAAWTVAQHTAAADAVVTTIEPLSVDAQQIYSALSDADATAATSFLSGGLEPQPVRHRYLTDIARATGRLEAATAAAAAASQSSATVPLARLTDNLPLYTGMIETARADNRVGYPLGAAYLRSASGLMRATLLPAARDLYAQENSELAAAEGQATGLPYLAIGLALVAAYLLLRAQRWLARRTHRMMNRGLLAASAVGLLSAAWLFSAITVARVHLQAATAQGSAPVEALARADIAALRAHSDESLTLVDNDGDDAFQKDFVSVAKQLGPGPGTLLTGAAVAARGSAGAAQAAAAAAAAPAWYAVHVQLRSLDDRGLPAAAVQLAVGSGPRDSGGLFGRVHAGLTTAISEDQAAFRSAGHSGLDDLVGLEAGMIAASLLMAAACAWGLMTRLAEYR